MRKLKPLNDISAEDLKQIFLNRLARAPQTRAGLVAYAQLRQVPQEIYEPVLDRLVEVGLINDAEYAAMWVRSRRAIRGAGPRALKMELAQKGIPAELAEKAIADRSGDDYETAYRIAQRKVQSLSRLPVEKARKRVLDFLLRRGYDYTIAMAVLSALDFETPEVNEL